MDEEFQFQFYLEKVQICIIILEGDFKFSVLISTRMRDNVWYSHNMLAIPKDGVSVEIYRWVEPEVHPLLSVSLPMGIHVGLDRIWLPRPIPQELKVELISNSLGC